MSMKKKKLIVSRVPSEQITDGEDGGGLRLRPVNNGDVEDAAERGQHRIFLTFGSKKLETAYHISKENLYLSKLRYATIASSLIGLISWVVDAISIFQLDKGGDSLVTQYLIVSAITILLPLLLLIGRIKQLRPHIHWICLANFLVLQILIIYLGAIVSSILGPWGSASFFRRALLEQLWFCIIAPIAIRQALIGISLQVVFVLVGVLLGLDLWGIGHPIGGSPVVGLGLALTVLISGAWWLFQLYSRDWIERRRFLLSKRSDAERKRIDWEKSLSQRLLLNIFPKVIIEKFKRDKATIVEEFSEVTIFFSDIVSFTQMSSTKTPIQLVTLLNDLFSRFDEIVDRHNLEKIKTIGDAYMAVGGVPIASSNHAENVARMSLEVMEAVKDFNMRNSQLLKRTQWNIRVGLHTGSVVAGVIGKKKYLYDIYGESVNVASLMEQTGASGKIHVSETTHYLLQKSFQFEEAPPQKVGSKMMKTYWLITEKSDNAPDPNFVDTSDHETIDHAMARIPALSLSISNPIWKHLNQEIEDLGNIKPSKWTLIFPPSDIEREFRNYFASSSVRRTQWITLGLLPLFFVVEAIEEAFNVGGIGRIILRVFRYGVGVPSTALLLLLTRFNIWQQYCQLLQMVFSIVLVLGSLLIAYFQPFGTFAPMVAIAVTLGIPLRFPSAIPVAVGGLILSPIAWGIGWALTGTNREAEWSNCLITLLVVGAAAIAKYFSEKILRKVFVESKLVERQHERLLIERNKSEELLVNLLPVAIAQALKEGDQTIAERHPNVTIMFVHVLGLAGLEARLELKDLFKLVNHIFCKFDDITEVHKIEKIKTIGSSYMVASGLQNISETEELVKELIKVVDTAVDMINYIDHFNKESHQKSSSNLIYPAATDLSIRIGIHVGPVVAGVIGKKKFAYDLWGDVVNVASRMESTGEMKRIQVTESVYNLLKDEFDFEEREIMNIKGKGEMKTYFLNSKRIGEPLRRILMQNSVPDLFSVV